MKKDAIPVLSVLLLFFVAIGVFTYVTFKQDVTQIDSSVVVEDITTQKACEAAGHAWLPQGKAQIHSCVALYDDGGKSCESSEDCQGNCIKKDVDGPAMCAQDSTWHGCKNTVENIAKGEGILCID